MRALTISAISIVVGALCMILENTFYQYIDEEGILHESLFMPIGVLLVSLGLAGLVYSLAKLFVQSKRKHN